MSLPGKVFDSSRRWCALSGRYLSPRAFRQYWGSLPALWKQFLVNALIGAVIVLVLHVFHGSRMVQAQQNWGMDWLTRITANTSLSPKPADPIIYIDIDTGTWLAWDEPWLTPAEELANVVSNALGAQPAQLIVDLDLSRRDDLAPLHGVLARHGQESGVFTQVILMKTFTLLPADSAGAVPAARQSMLDELVSDRDELHWAAPLFRRGSDGVVRSWDLVSPVCPDTAATWLPSAQLLSVALSHGVWPEVETALQKGTNQGCHDRPDNPGAFRVAGHRVDPTADGPGKAIVYSLPWQPERGYRSLAHNGMQVPALTTLSARHLAKADTPVEPTLARGSIMIIGASHPDSGDLHYTPLGMMPGSLIIANAIASFEGFRQLDKPSLPVILLVELALLFIMSWLFVRFRPGMAALLSIGFIIVVVIPGSLLAFRQGVWLDFALPLVAVEIHRLVAVAEGALHEWKHRE